MEDIAQKTVQMRRNRTKDGCRDEERKLKLTHQPFLSRYPVASELSAIFPACTLGTAPQAMAFQIAL